jgi:hypothetical protein
MFFAVFLLMLVLAICVSLSMIKLLAPVVNITIAKIFVEDLRGVWGRYVKIALFVLGVSSGVSVPNLQNFFQGTNKKFSPELLISEAWKSIQNSAVTIIVAVFALFFIYLIVTYLNQLAHQSLSDKQTKDKNAFDAPEIQSLNADDVKHNTPNALNTNIESSQKI